MAKLSAAMTGQVPMSVDEHLYLSSLQEDLYALLSETSNFPAVFEGVNVYLEALLEKLNRKIVLNEIEIFDILTLLEFPSDFEARLKAYRVCMLIEVCVLVDEITL